MLETILLNALTVLAADEEKASVTIHDKYAKIQKLYRSFIDIQRIASSHPENAQMKKAAESAKKQVEKLANDIKIGISKIEKSEVGPNFKKFGDDAQELVKKIYKSAKIKRAAKEVKCVEDTQRGTWYINSLLIYKIEAKDATPLFLNLMQVRDIEGQNQGYDFFIYLEQYGLSSKESLQAMESINSNNSTARKLEEMSIKLVDVGSRRGYKMHDTPETKKSGSIVSATNFLNSLRFPHQENADEAEVRKNSVSRNFRSGEYFTSRDHEEDDDNPRFTGRKDVIEHVKSRMPSDLKDAKINAYEQEKEWFTVQIDV